MSKTAIVTAALLVQLSQLLVAGPASAEEVPPFPVASTEFSYQIGYGITHRGFGETRTQVQTVDFIGRFGYFLSEEIGYGWYRGQYQHAVEIPLHLAVDPRVRIMTGGNLLAKWNFLGLSDDHLIPYVFGGGGVLYVDLGLKTMGSRLCFSYGAGTGIQYLVRKDLALSAEYRYHHISNANTEEPNEPLNSSKVLFGVSYFR